MIRVVVAPADGTVLEVVIAEKVAVYVPTGTAIRKSWQKTVPVCPADNVMPPTRT